MTFMRSKVVPAWCNSFWYESTGCGTEHGTMNSLVLDNQESNVSFLAGVAFYALPYTCLIAIDEHIEDEVK
ncbi:uncharacterized protein N7477_005861 [Penicillium maclennaniae]|uniref:uncharacterized protein n=1 Tax=Penicillium maclennaniae TaxID=1343394 RepID=UPI00254005E7|nr:uncharacterized protein N7477_005861 [Penicillium maclennaniae]KAJ5670498.1 hypothetical protein N7477_005861 [Penicillium maclennaniae]